MSLPSSHSSPSSSFTTPSPQLTGPVPPEPPEPLSHEHAPNDWPSAPQSWTPNVPSGHGQLACWPGVQVPPPTCSSPLHACPSARSKLRSAAGAAHDAENLAVLIIARSVFRKRNQSTLGEISTRS